jgi:uncharacterized protein
VAATLVMGAAAAFIVLLALLFGSCGGGDNVERQPLTIVAANGTTARLQVEIADTEEERSKGLSGRTEVPLDTGMLFVSERGVGFWMKDTLVALSVAFLADCGEILDIQDMEPRSLEVHDTDQPYRFGLEVAQGWFERNGIAVGDVVGLPRDVRPDQC